MMEPTFVPSCNCMNRSCGAKAVGMKTDQNSYVVWCENGHVTVWDSGQSMHDPKTVFDFSSREETIE